MNEKGDRVENGEIEIFNEENLLIWKGDIKNKEKWNGKGMFEWKDNKNKVWNCKGKNILFFIFKIILVFFE